MLFITSIENTFCIGQFPTLANEGFVYIFDQHFLSKKLYQQLTLLPIFSGGTQMQFSLTKTQESMLSNIFEKMNEEKVSTYIFANDFQRVYLMELIHFTMKIYQANNTLV